MSYYRCEGTIAKLIKKEAQQCPKKIARRDDIGEEYTVSAYNGNQAACLSCPNLSTKTEPNNLCYGPDQ